MVEEMRIPAKLQVAGMTLEELETRGRSSFLIVAIRREDGTAIHKPPLATKLREGDTLIVMCHEGVAPEFTEQFLVRREIRYRGAASA